MADQQKIVANLLEHAGTTYADDAGITLRDTPAPLFQLLTLAMLASKPINAEIAVTAFRELNAAGLRTPDAVLDAERQTMINAFGRAHYARYDESSATRLIEMATRVHDEYSGDLRKLAEHAEQDVESASRALQQFKGIGPTGAAIFLREVQDVWPWARPYFDERTVQTAADLGLPKDPAHLGELAPENTATLAAALVRVSLDADLREQLRA
ncbi:MAG: endonuclease [Mycobacterium sp.]